VAKTFLWKIGGEDIVIGQEVRANFPRIDNATPIAKYGSGKKRNKEGAR